VHRGKGLHPAGLIRGPASFIRGSRSTRKAEGRRARAGRCGRTPPGGRMRAGMLLVAAFLAFLGALPGPASAENLGFLLVLDSDANDQAYPALAHGEGNERYLAVWEDRTSGAIVGELMTADGTAVLDDFPIASKGGSDQGLYRPAVGYRPADDRFIVVWNRITSAGDSEIRGLVLDSDGTPVSPERLVAAVGSTTVPTGAVIAAVSWPRWCMAWMRRRRIACGPGETRC